MDDKNKYYIIASLLFVIIFFCVVLLANRIEKPIFTFLQISDLHTGGYDWADVNRLPEAPITSSIVQDVMNEKSFPMPDFVLLSGDLVQSWNLDANGNPKWGQEKTEACFYKVIETFNQLPIPWYPIVGNHDNSPQDYILWDKHFPERRYYFEYGNWLFIALDDFRFDWDCTGWDYERDNIRREWLRGVLDAHPKHYIIIITHIPLVPMKARLPKQPPIYAYVDVQTHPSVKEILEECDNVVAVLSGHLHLNEVIIENGIYHIATAAASTFPYMYRHFTVYKNRIEVKSYRINSSSIIKDTKLWKKFGYTENGDYTRPEVENFVIPIGK